MTVTDAQALMETTIRLVRVYADTLPMFDADGDPRIVTGLAFAALLEQGRVPQVMQQTTGGVAVDDVVALLSHLKDVMWDAVGAEAAAADEGLPF